MGVGNDTVVIRGEGAGPGGPEPLSDDSPHSSLAPPARASRSRTPHVVVRSFRRALLEPSHARAQSAACVKDGHGRGGDGLAQGAHQGRGQGRTGTGTGMAHHNQSPQLPALLVIDVGLGIEDLAWMSASIDTDAHTSSSPAEAL